MWTSEENRDRICSSLSGAHPETRRVADMLTSNKKHYRKPGTGSGTIASLKISPSWAGGQNSASEVLVVVERVLTFS